MANVAAAMEKHVEQFLEALAARGASRATVRAYRADLGAYTAWLVARDLRPEDATRADLRAYAASLGARGLAPSSRARALSAVRALHRRLLDTGVADTDPAADLPGPRRPRRLPTVVREPDAVRLLDATWGDEPLDLRDHALLELLYGCGLRAAEACALDRGDVSPREVRVNGKGERVRLVPIGGPAYEAVAALARARAAGARRGRQRRRAAALAPRPPPGAVGGAPRARPPPALRRAAAGEPARTAPRLRHPHAGARRRPACDPGTPRA